MPDHLDTFALTMTTGTAPAPRTLTAASADPSALTTAVLSYEAVHSTTAAEVEWATADGTVQRAILSGGSRGFDDVISLDLEST